MAKLFTLMQTFNRHEQFNKKIKTKHNTHLITAVQTHFLVHLSNLESFAQVFMYLAVC